MTSPILRALISRRVAAPELSDPILAAVYVTIWRTADSFDPESSGSVWRWVLTILALVMSSTRS